MPKKTYKEIFSKWEEIAQEVVVNYMTFKEAAEKWGCTKQLVQTFVRQYHEKSHLKFKEPEKMVEPVKFTLNTLLDSFDDYDTFINNMKVLFLKRKIKKTGSVVAASKMIGLHRTRIHEILRTQPNKG